MADNLNYNGFVSTLEKGNLKNLYLFYGSEPMLINDCIARMEKKLITPAFRSLNYIKMDGSAFNMDSLINACETLPFMDKKKMVVIYDCPFFKSKKGDKGSDESNNPDEITAYLSAIPDSTVLVLIANSELDKRRKIYNTIKKSGVIVECSMLKSGELIKWIVKGFEYAGKKISYKDASYLAGRVSGNLEEMKNEINKLCLYCSEKANIDTQDIEAVVPKSLEMNIFQLVDSVAGRKPGQALKILNELILNGEPIPIILTMIIRQYRLMLNSKLLSMKGYSGSEISRKLSLNPYVGSKIIQLSSKYTVDQLEQRLKMCLNADYSIKTGNTEQRIAVECLIVEFAKVN